MIGAVHDCPVPRRHRLAPEIRYALTLLLLGAALRFVALGTNPPGLFRDEAEKVHTAWSLATTGGYRHLVMSAAGPAFEWRPAGLFLDAYGSWTSAIYHVADAPFALALGPTAWAARLPAAIAGALTLLFVWLAARRVFDREVALVALLFLAISPWHVLFSRWAQQGIFVPLWLALALWLFERGRLAAGRGWWIAGVAFGLALYTYAPMRLTVPLFMLALAWAHRGDLRRHRRAALLALLAFLLTVLPVALWLTLNRDAGMQRFGRVSIWQEGATLGSVTMEFVANYLRHLSVPFLFLAGDANPRHSVPGFGQMHWIELPGLLVALLMAVTQRRPQDRMLALWFFLAPVAASLTRESPHALRAIAALPAAHLLSAAGSLAIFRAAACWARINIEGLRIIALVVVGVTAMLFTLQLFLRAPALTAEAWETGLHDALRRAAPAVERGTPVFVTGRALYLPTHLLVAQRTRPRDLTAAYLPRGWNQCGTGATSPAALWARLGGAASSAVFLTTPGEIPGHAPTEVIVGPGNRFTPAPRPLWELHVGAAAQTILESPAALP